MAKWRREIAKSPYFIAARQGGDNISRKARIVASSIDDRKIRTVVDDDAPVLRFRFDGERWERWSVAWRTYEPAPIPPPLLAHLEAEALTLAAGDRYALEAGAWRHLGPDEPDEPSAAEG